VLSLLLPAGYPSLAENLQLTPLFLLGWVLCLAGAISRLHCYRVLAEQFTFELGINKDHRLITTGIYSIVRHPSYTGALFAGAGALISYSSPGSLFTECARGTTSVWPMVGLGFEALLMVMLFKMLQKRMEKEDVMLRDEFQEEWDQWAEQVPYKLVPGIY
jgi:protein-S-isoprenylcysteine O-methyltransferase Ste14